MLCQAPGPPVGLTEAKSLPEPFSLVPDATHRLADTQDIDCRYCASSWVRVHAPFSGTGSAEVRMPPRSSTAPQNDSEAHEISHTGEALFFTAAEVHDIAAGCVVVKIAGLNSWLPRPTHNPVDGHTRIGPPPNACPAKGTAPVIQAAVPPEGFVLVTIP